MSIDLYNSNKKYKDLVDTGRAMIFKYGMKRVTIEEICDEADVSKVTFYKFFRNKEDLIITIFRIWIDRMYKEYCQIMNSDLSVLEKIEASFNFRIKISKEYSDEFIYEIMRENEKISEFFQNERNKFITQDLNMFRQAQQEGIISRDIKPEFIMYLIDHSRDILFDEKLKSIFPDLQDRIRQLMHFFYFGMAQRDADKKSGVRERMG